MQRILVYSLTFIVLLFSAGCTSTGSESRLESLGLQYQMKELRLPRPNRAHVLRVDLANGKIQPVMIIANDPDEDGPAEAALTDPLKLANKKAVLAFVNTNPWDSFPDATGMKNRKWFEGQPVDIRGLAVADGQIKSSARSGCTSLWWDETGTFFMGDSSAEKPIIQGTAGFQQIVSDGEVIVAPGGELHPRTAIGVDRNGKIIWLVVVDGRQKEYSEGMSLYELGSFMRDLDCWKAMNMDGGGSSIMGLANHSNGSLRIVNSPSDRHLGIPKIRPLPAILTIRKK